MLIKGAEQVLVHIESMMDAIKKKKLILDCIININNNPYKIEVGKHIIFKDVNLFISDVKPVINHRYFKISFDNGEIIHYDTDGKAYVSLDPNSPAYKLRLNRYDINKLI